MLPDFLRGHVKAALLQVFGNRRLSDGQLGFFHADNLTFGEGVFLSRMVAAAQAVPGVESVSVTQLERLFEGPNQELENGLLPLSPLEIARLDNDPGYPREWTATPGIARWTMRQDSISGSCGCCEGVEALTPQAVENRPGLSALRYRVGTQATFFETMPGASFQPVPGCPGQRSG